MMTDSGSGPPDYGAFDLPRPMALPDRSHAELQFLRLLGRLKLMVTPQIYRVAFPQESDRSTRYRLAKLLAERLVWRIRLPYGILHTPRAQHARPPIPQPYMYGLTAEGKTLIQTLDMEPDQRSWDVLQAREAHGRVPERTLGHDLQASWWCASIVEAVRWNAWCQSLFVQVEYIPHEQQRIDALVVVRLNPTVRRQVDGTIPWFDGTPIRPGEIDIRLALEVDRGTEQLSVLLGKAVTYRDLTTQGVYHHLFGGPILPVFLVPKGKRAAQIATEWQKAWPHGCGVVSTPRSADHEVHGVLWGEYRPLVQTQTWTALLTQLQQTTQGHMQGRPAMTFETWEQGQEQP